MSFFFSVLSFSFKLWERERGYTKFGIRRNSPKGTYLIFRRGSTGESFFFYGLTNLFLFSILAWRTLVIRVRDIFLFVFVYPEYLAFGSVHHEPCPRTHFFYFLFPLTGRSPHFRFRVPANHFASLSFPLVSGDLSEVTKYQHLLVSPLWPTFFLNGHSLTACYCSFKREDSINLISIVSVGHHVTVSNKGDTLHQTGRSILLLEIKCVNEERQKARQVPRHCQRTEKNLWNMKLTVRFSEQS